MARGKKDLKSDEFVPEVVDAGVVRDQEKENPIEGLENEEFVRTPGKWKKVPVEQIIQLEKSGKLVGYDPATGEVLVKEEK